MADDLSLYPRGKIAMGNGDLMQVTNFRIELNNGGKLKHTLRSSPSGATLGNQECTVSFDYEVPEDGPEHDYMKLVRDGTVKQLRAKVPGKTYTVNGIYNQSSVEAPLDDAVRGSVSFIGRLEKS